jgi:hypothetical protein
MFQNSPKFFRNMSYESFKDANDYKIKIFEIGNNYSMLNDSSINENPGQSKIKFIFKKIF